MNNNHFLEEKQKAKSNRRKAKKVKVNKAV
jgi:hypothetical protein